ncbi:MAG: hypothetical protein JXQ96_01560 [Cyclobacteriaceae bacterium]
MTYMKSAFSLLLFFTLNCGICQKVVSTHGLDLNADVSGWYDNQIGLENTVLATGKISRLRTTAPTTVPYFETKNWRLGALTYMGQKFTNIPMVYDVERDELLVNLNIESDFRNVNLQLTKEYVSSFTLENNHFRYVPDKIGSYNEGFYEVLFDTNILTLIKKHDKQLKTDSDLLINIYMEQAKYFLKYQNGYYRISGKTDILKLFRVNRQEIKEFTKMNRYKGFRKNDESDLIKVISYCASLIDE